MWKQRILLAGLVLVTAAAAWLWAHEGHEALPTRGVTVDAVKGIVILSPAARNALGPETAEVTVQTIEERWPAPVTLVAPWRQHAFATTRLGGKIARVHVQPGQRVAPGQVLAEVQSLELENLELEWLQALNDSKLSAEILRQLETAGQRGTVPEQQFLEARLKDQDNRNALEIARRKLLGLGMERIDADAGASPAPALAIRSPIGGTVIHADIVVGQIVEPTEHLFEIIALPTVWARFGILEKDCYRVQPGQPFELRLAAYPGPDDVFRGRISSVGLALEQPTQLATAWADLPNAEGRLLPGLFGQAQLSGTVVKDALVVPAAAVVTQGAEQLVFVEEGPGQYLRQYIVVGQRTRERVQVRQSRLVPGDRVVTAGSHELAGLFVYGSLRPSPEAIVNLGLRVEPVQLRPVARVVHLNGIVDLPPSGRAVASARLPGTIHRIHVDRDQSVQAGAIIAEVASLELQNWQLELLNAHLKSATLEQTLQRWQPLAKSDRAALSSRQVREMQSTLNAVRQRRDSFQRRLRAVGLSTEQVQAVMERGEFVDALPVRAPIAGVVVRFQGVLGQVVKAEDPLFEIHDLRTATIRAHVFERQLAGVRLGQPARVRLAADPDFLADAVVVRSGQLFGSDDRTLAIWAELRSAPTRPLQQGMLARLTLIQEEGTTALAVPVGALVYEGSHAFAFAQQQDGSFERRLVKPGRADDRFVEVLTGLNPGEGVAVRGVDGLQTAFASIR